MKVLFENDKVIVKFMQFQGRFTILVSEFAFDNVRQSHYWNLRPKYTKSFNTMDSALRYAERFKI